MLAVAFNLRRIKGFYRAGGFNGKLCGVTLLSSNSSLGNRTNKARTEMDRNAKVTWVGRGVMKVLGSGASTTTSDLSPRSAVIDSRQTGWLNSITRAGGKAPE